MTKDQIWEELCKVYNMPDVPDEAKEIIGNTMLALEENPNIVAEPELIVSPLLKKTQPKGH